MTEKELKEESDKLNAQVTKLGFTLKRLPHEASDKILEVYYQATDERRAYGQGASWEEAIIEAAKKALKR